jgi:hypothetical protein
MRLRTSLVWSVDIYRTLKFSGVSYDTYIHTSAPVDLSRGYNHYIVLPNPDLSKIRQLISVPQTLTWFWAHLAGFLIRLAPVKHSIYDIKLQIKIAQINQENLLYKYTGLLYKYTGLLYKYTGGIFLKMLIECQSWRLEESRGDPLAHSRPSSMPPRSHRLSSVWSCQPIQSYDNEESSESRYGYQTGLISMYLTHSPPIRVPPQLEELCHMPSCHPNCEASYRITKPSVLQASYARFHRENLWHMQHHNFIISDRSAFTL